MASGVFSSGVLYNSKIKSPLGYIGRDTSLVLSKKKKTFLEKVGETNLAKSNVSNELSLDQERDLIAQAKKGDNAAFQKLFEQNYSRIYSAALRILGNTADASDLSQDAFLKAYKNLNSFQGTSSFYTWVYRILFNASIDFKRKASSRNELSGSEDFVFETDGSDPLSSPFHSDFSLPDDQAYAMELRKIIGLSLEELSPTHKQVIICREVDGLSYEEISQALGCSVGTIMSRLFHARKNLINILRSKLEPKFNCDDRTQFNINY